MRSGGLLIQTGYGEETVSVCRRKSVGVPNHHFPQSYGSDLLRGDANLLLKMFDKSWAYTSSSKFICNKSPSFHYYGDL